MCLVEIIVKSVQTLGHSIVGADFENSGCIVALCLGTQMMHLHAHLHIDHFKSIVLKLKYKICPPKQLIISSLNCQLPLTPIN